MGSNELLKEKLAFGEPFVLASSAVSVSFPMYLDGTEPAANVSRPVNDFTKPLPEEVVALLRHGGMERAARILFVGIPSDVKTPEVVATIRESLGSPARLRRHAHLVRSTS